MQIVFENLGLFFQKASEDICVQVGGWFVEEGALPDVGGAQVRNQELTYVGSLFF